MGKKKSGTWAYIGVGGKRKQGEQPEEEDLRRRNGGKGWVGVIANQARLRPRETLRNLKGASQNAKRGHNIWGCKSARLFLEN